MEEILQCKKMCKGLRVLIVDDDEILTSVFEEVSKRFFQYVEISNNSKEVAENFEKNKYDIIYTDLNMPLMSGIELITSIREVDLEQKFIIISASDDSDKLMELLALNISSFIVKPFSIANFVRVTREQVSVILQNRFMLDQKNELNQKLLKVTKEKEAQEHMLIQQTKLAQTGEMISVIAHQWRQPLSSITAQLSTLKTHIDLDIYESVENPYVTLSSDFLKCSGQIEETVKFLSATINDFRNFYRPNNNNKKVFKICDALKSVLAMLNHQHRDIEFVLKYEHYESTEVYTYESEFKQVVMSIINNAIDAITEKLLQNPKILISFKEDEENLLLGITDNAGGIPVDVIEHIFLPYFSTKNEKNGTGLGLYMAKTIMEKHINGGIEVKNSVEFGGAEFVLKIPKLQESKDVYSKRAC